MVERHASNPGPVQAAAGRVHDPPVLSAFPNQGDRREERCREEYCGGDFGSIPDRPPPDCQGHARLVLLAAEQIMIENTSGNILVADAEALVNTVNCVGVMGRGIALQFKQAYPDNFKAYVVACKREELQPGKMFVFE